MEKHKLRLGFNKIKTLPPEVEHWENLEYLSIRGESLVSLPPEISGWRKLKNLDLVYNYGLKTLPIEFAELRLDSLYLNCTGLSQETEDWAYQVVDY